MPPLARSRRRKPCPSIVSAASSNKTSTASAKSTPCFVWFAFALVPSHSKFTWEVYAHLCTRQPDAPGECKWLPVFSSAARPYEAISLRAFGASAELRVTPSAAGFEATFVIPRAGDAPVLAAESR